MLNFIKSGPLVQAYIKIFLLFFTTGNIMALENQRIIMAKDDVIVFTGTGQRRQSPQSVRMKRALVCGVCLWPDSMHPMFQQI